MDKVKTSGKPRKSSANTSRKTYKLKKGVRLPKHDPLKTLTDEHLVAQAFWECLRDNDPEGAMEVISAHLNALNKVQFAKESEIPRSTVYHSIKSKNPTLRTVAKLIHCGI
jgi:DNA-binding phage protein